MIPLLLDHLWQSTLFAAGAGLLTLAFTRNSAAIRYGLWFAASIKFLVPFSTLIALGGFAFQAFTPPVPPLLYEGFRFAAAPFARHAPVPGPASAAFDVTLWLVGAWALGCAAITTLWLLRWLKLRAVLRAATPLLIAAPLPVKSSAALLEPGLVGAWRPVLLLPQGIADHLTQPEMNAILAHELCHLRRRDNLLAALHMLVEALFWFHPLVWWLGTRLIAERENACDEAVLAAGSDPHIYAQSILKVCQFYLHSPLACASGVSGADLKERMETIMENRITLRLNAFKKGLLTAGAVTTLAAPLALGLLTTPPAITPALAANQPNPGTESPPLRGPVVQRADKGPSPGLKAAIRRELEADRLGDPAFEIMSPALQNATKQKWWDISRDAKSLGAVQAITFQKINGQGWDVYQVTFAHGSANVSAPPLVDGKFVGLGHYNIQILKAS